MRHRNALLIAVFWAVTSGYVPAEGWPQFRGPTAQGLYTGKDLPLEWSPTKNITWKQAIPGHGWSSPIVYRERVYLTTAMTVPDSKDLSLQALCLDAKTGGLLWRTRIFRENGSKSPRPHPKNSHASPTPLTDGKRLYVHFGHEGTACLDLDGKVVWRNTDLRYQPVHGNGGTPVLVDGRLILSVDGADKQFVVALDAETGKVAWKTDRKSTAVKKFSFSTPLLARVQGRPQIISPASEAVMAYDPVDGKELWRLEHDGYSVVPAPVFGHEMLFMSTGYDRPVLLAIRLHGTSVTKDDVAWSTTQSVPVTPSPLLVGGELYLISDQGIASCFDAPTGKLHWRERIGGNFSASPIYAAGRVYLQSEEGVTTVIRAATRFERLAQNDIQEPTLASMAAADGAIYLRTKQHLYRIERQGGR